MKSVVFKTLNYAFHNMAVFQIQRDHHLGLIKARALAYEWVAQAQSRFAMDCVYEEGEMQDIVRFSHPGAKGTLSVTSNSFLLATELSFLLRPFKEQISREIQKNLETLLGKY